MWAETQNGNLINLKRIFYVGVFPAGENSFTLRAYRVQAPFGDDIHLYTGTRQECDDIKRHFVEALLFDRRFFSFRLPNESEIK